MEPDFSSYTTDELVREICRRLAESPIEPEELGYDGERTSAREARAICGKLLSASCCDGLGGCRLCQG